MNDLKDNRLYKLTSKGDIQYWKVWTVDNYILTEYGLLGTASPQITKDIITEGKSLGKVNESSPQQQAALEAAAKYQKKLKSGYVTSIEAARGGQVDAVIEGGILPMLAHTSDHLHKIKYPCYISCKIDGIRCIAIKKEGKVTLWSRTRKPITSCPHIVAHLESYFPDGIYDGELYSHQFKDNFEHMVHLVKQVTPCEGHEDVQYHIFDLAEGGTFSERIMKITQLHIDYLKKHTHPEHIKFVDTYYVRESEVPDYFTEFLSQGYEGLMLRNSAGLYVNKRSYDLIKMKEMQDAEFKIIGIEEGRGRLMGHVGSFVLQTDSGSLFNAKLCGSTSYLKECFEDHSLWRGKKMTVQFQSYSNDLIPRFPVGLRIYTEL